MVPNTITQLQQLTLRNVSSRKVIWLTLYSNPPTNQPSGYCGEELEGAEVDMERPVGGHCSSPGGQCHGEVRINQGQWTDSGGMNMSVSASPRSRPETRISAQVVYLGSGNRNRWMGRRDMEGRRKAASVFSSQLPFSRTSVQFARAGANETVRPCDHKLLRNSEWKQQSV